MIASFPTGDPIKARLLNLRPDMSDQEDTIVEAGHMIQKLEEVVKKVTSPANRIGTFLGALQRYRAHRRGRRDYYCNVDPRIPLATEERHARFVNEAFVIVGDLGFETAGPVTKSTEVLEEDRLRVGSEHGTQSMVLQRSADLVKVDSENGRRSPG